MLYINIYKVNFTMNIPVLLNVFPFFLLESCMAPSPPYLSLVPVISKIVAMI